MLSSAQNHSGYPTSIEHHQITTRPNNQHDNNTINPNTTTTLPLSPSSPMSELQKSFAKAKLAKLPSEAPMIPEQPAGGFTIHPIGESDNDNSDASSTATAVPSPTRQLFAKPNRGCVYFVPGQWQHFIVTIMLWSHDQLLFKYLSFENKYLSPADPNPQHP